MEIYKNKDVVTSRPLPFYTSKVMAGFPSPAEDYIEKQLDLNELLIAHPAATFFVRVEGDSMCEAGIQSGDILVVDRSVEAVSGKIVIAVLNGEFTVKRLKKEKEHIWLLPENSHYPVIKVTSESDFQIWGVVTYVIHRTQ
jgi:DNA polymerase V